MEGAAKTDLETKKEYDAMMSSDSSHYPYTLFLSERAYIKNIHVPYLYSTDLDKTVEMLAAWQ